MIALFILLFAVGISIFINNIATKALTLTGLSRDVASFQARSITTGTGFTTDEAKALVGHPARRKIVKLLMIVQNAGLITVISTFILSFVNTDSSGIALQRAVILIAGLGILLFLSRNEWLNKQLEKVIDWMLEKYTNLTVIDYNTMLNLQDGFTVSRIQAEEDSWLENQSLEELNLHDEGVMVLCIECPDGSTNCAPAGKDEIDAGDELTLYGRESGFNELRNRKKDREGEQAHEKAKQKHEQENN